MQMTKERLEEYRSKKAEITELKFKLAHLGEGDSMTGNSVINDYTKGYPRPQAVVGFDEKKYERLRAKYESRLASLQQECQEIEMWIEEIPDSITRRIFRMYYIDGLTQQQVALKMSMDKSTVSRKIDNFFKVATNATNATV